MNQPNAKNSTTRIGGKPPAPIANDQEKRASAANALKIPRLPLRNTAAFSS